jgi:hypothetical protein
MLSGVYRARKNVPGTDFHHAKELWYPPASEITKPGRLNDVGQVMFYAANMPNTTLLELRPNAGETFTVLLARTKSRPLETLNIAFLGLERCLAPETRHFSDNDLFRRSEAFRRHIGESNYRKWLLIDDYLSSIFGELVPIGGVVAYKRTIALADLVFSAPTVDGVCYPSVATHDHGINLCLLPSKADEIFVPMEAWVVEIGTEALHPTTGEPLHEIRFVKRSKEIDARGLIEWMPPGMGLDPLEIARFTRRRISRLTELPRQATG